MRTRSSHGEVYLARLGSQQAPPERAPTGASGAAVRLRLSRSNQKLVLVWRNRARLGFLSRRGPSGRTVCSGEKEQLEMKRISVVGMCLMAVFAISAVAASSASAGELLFKATNTTGGATIVGGSFESLGGLSVLRTLGGSTIHCEHVDNHGRFLSTTLGDVLILFLNCETEVFGSSVKCHNSGTQDIHLPLETTLFHLGLAHLGSNTSIPAIDILLDNTLEFKCSIATVKVSGSAIGALQVPLGTQAPLNQPEKEVNLVYNESEPGMQELTEFLMPGGTLVKQHLNSTILAAEESAEKSTDTLNKFTNSKGEATEIELVEP